MTEGLPLWENPEEKEKERVLALLARLRKAYLTRIRAEMSRIYLERLAVDREAYVTADDARVFFESLDPPSNLSRNFLGATFKTKEWEPCGVYLSRTEGSHANRLLCWRLTK